MDNYPSVSFYFKVIFTDDTKSAVGETSFQEVSGLSVDIAPEEIKEGGVLEFSHKVPTVPKYNNIVLKRGLLTSSAVREWIQKGINEFTFTPWMLTIELLNAEGKPSMTWNVYNVWPVKWEVSNFNSTGNDIAIETLELAFDYFKLS